MTRRTVREAYESVRPDADAKKRMLDNILSGTGGNSSIGKDKHMKKRSFGKLLLIAAIIALMVIMMGCAVIMFSLQDLKIGEISLHGDILDSSGNVIMEKDVPQDMISLHGYVNSPAYLAHQEWFEFEKNYDPDLSIRLSAGDFDVPEAYYAYNPYTQEMVDKIDEIVEKYGLNLLGACATFQRWEKKVFFEALDIQSLLLPDSEAVITEMSGYFYERGNFKVEFDMEMSDEEGCWPYTMNNSIYYSRKDNFDDVMLNIGNIDLWQQWQYTTPGGIDVLIACYDYGAIVFCDREDVFIKVQIDNNYETDYSYKTGSFETNIVMTKQQLEQVVDQIDFGIEVESVNMDLAKEKLEQYRGK